MRVARNRCKDHLLETAAELFYKNGFHATGIDTIIAEAEVSRMSLYNNFASKDDLIISVLNLQTSQIQAWFKDAVSSNATPDERLDQLFDEFGRRWSSSSFCGCPVTKAVSEYSEQTHPVHQAALEHERQIAALLEALCVEMKLPAPQETAVQLLTIIDGATLRASIFGDPAAAEIARSCAWALVDTARKSTT